MIDENFLMITIMKSESFYQIPSARTIKSAHSGGMKMTSFIFCKKILSSQKCSVIEVKVMINTIWHSEFKLTYGHSDSWNIIDDPENQNYMHYLQSARSCIYN